MPDPAFTNLNDLFKNFFEDKNKNGIPDIFEHTTPEGESFSIRSSQIIINGKEYKSMEDVPEKEKEKFAEILKKFEGLRPSSTMFTRTDFSAKPTEKLKESKIVLDRTEGYDNKMSTAKIFNIVLLILLAIAAWFIWGRR